jgi:adenylate cyclase
LLVAARVLQAIGGSMLNPVAMSIIRNVFEDPRERAQAIGVWGGVVGISLALGPVVGGALVGISWRAIFLVNIPVGLAAIALTARSLADPLESVRRAVRQVQRGEEGARVDVYDGSELGLLQAGFNQMVEGLRERERLRDLFGRQVGEDVARQALERGITLGGEELEVAVLFIDLVGSTELAHRRPAAEVVEVLNDFFCVVVDVVDAEGGAVNKFVGDAALCVFGAPLPHDDAAGAALRAARLLRERLAEEVPDCDVGIGVSAGTVVAGNIGAQQRFEYTVIGDPVNEASRLTELAKQHDGRVLASEAALSRAGSGEEVGRWMLGETETLRGRAAPTRLAAPS